MLLLATHFSFPIQYIFWRLEGQSVLQQKWYVHLLEDCSLFLSLTITRWYIQFLQLYSLLSHFNYCIWSTATSKNVISRSLNNLPRAERFPVLHNETLISWSNCLEHDYWIATPIYQALIFVVWYTLEFLLGSLSLYISLCCDNFWEDWKGIVFSTPWQLQWLFGNYPTTTFPEFLNLSRFLACCHQAECCRTFCKD